MLKKILHYGKVVLEASDKGTRNNSPIITIMGSIGAILFFIIAIFFVDSDRIDSFFNKLLLLLLFSLIPLYFIVQSIRLIRRVVEENPFNGGE